MPKPIVANGILVQQAAPPERHAKNCRIYGRVSTKEQDDRGYALPDQLAACQSMAHQDGYRVPDTHVFYEDYTGMSLNRPQLKQLRDFVHQGIVQAAVLE